MMKKILMMAILCLVFTTSGFAQFKRTAFNHVGLNAGVGTEGISIGVAAPISNFVELEAGVDILPKFLSISDKANITTDASIIVQGQTVRIPDSEVDIDADFSSFSIFFIFVLELTVDILELLPLQGVLLIAIIPRAMPWARSFWAFSPFLNHIRKFS